MQRYFVETKKQNNFILSKEDSYHVTKVMRMNINEIVEIVYDNELYLGKIVDLDINEVNVLETIKLANEELTIPKITIAQALVKEQKMDFILQKATELGVCEIIPLSVARSLIKIDKNDSKKQLRWQKICKEASEQSKRITIPNVFNIMNIKELVKLDYDVKILCSVNETSKSIKKVLQNITMDDRILIVVGPEGGFTLEEEKVLIDSGFISTSLGKLVLRTETVCLYMTSIINYHFMR